MSLLDLFRRWRPISTAPKRGSILVYEPGGGMGDAHWVPSRNLWATYAGDTVHPTHWMPFPKAPRRLTTARRAGGAEVTASAPPLRQG